MLVLRPSREELGKLSVVRCGNDYTEKLPTVHGESTFRAFPSRTEVQAVMLGPGVGCLRSGMHSTENFSLYTLDTLSSVGIL